MKEFDPYAPVRGPRGKIRQAPAVQELSLLEKPVKEGVEITTVRRFIRWRLEKEEEDLNTNQTVKIVELIRGKVRTAFYLRHVFAYWLVNKENKEMMLQYTNRGSPWFNNLADAEKWLNEKEEEKLEMEGGNISRPTKKWGFDMFEILDVKAVLDRQVLVGTGPLPEWLKNLAHSRTMVALDNFQDNLCLWRCLAVHQGARIDRCTADARRLAQAYFNRPCQDVPKTSLDEFEKVEKFLNKNKPRTGIRVYDPERLANGAVIWHLQRNGPEKVQNGFFHMHHSKVQNLVTIGVFHGHAFLIKEIESFARLYACKDCKARFTKFLHLYRHISTCSRGETKTFCPNKKLKAPQTAFEQAFFPKSNSSEKAIKWLESEAQKRNIHIHHAMCGHGGERMVEKGAVDGFHPPTRTVFQFHGCYFHSCPRCFHSCPRLSKPRGGSGSRGKSVKTQECINKLRRAGYIVEEKWNCQVGN